MPESPAILEPSIFVDFLQLQKYLLYSQTWGRLPASLGSKEGTGLASGTQRLAPWVEAGPIHLTQGTESGSSLFCCTNSKLPGPKEKQIPLKSSGSMGKLI